MNKECFVTNVNTLPFCTSNYCIILYSCMLLIAQHLFINISHHGYNHRHFHDRRKIKSLKITITNIIPFFLLTKWKSTSIWRHSNSTVGFRGRMWATLKGRIHTSICIQIWNIQIVNFFAILILFQHQQIFVSMSTIAAS